MSEARERILELELQLEKAKELIKEQHDMIDIIETCFKDMLEQLSNL